MTSAVTADDASDLLRLHVAEPVLARHASAAEALLSAILLMQEAPDLCTLAECAASGLLRLMELSVQFGKSAGTWILSATKGPALAPAWDLSRYPTNTWTIGR